MISPIFTVEAITTARRSRYFLIRAVYALCLLFVLWTAWQSQQMQSQFNQQGVANVAREFFLYFTSLQLTAVLLLTPALIAGTIAGEYERKTLDYLLACPLSSHAILAGKLAARLLLAGLLVATGLPVLAAAMLLGGIPPVNLLTTGVVTLATLIATGAMSLGVSVWSVRTRDAMLRSYVLLAALLVLPSVGYGVSFRGGWGRWDGLREIVAAVSEPLFRLNPYVVAYTEDLGYLALATAVHLTFAGAVIAYSAWRLRPVAARRSGAEARRWQVGWRWPRPAIFQPPLLWKEMFVEKTALRWGCLVRIVLWALLACIAVPTIGGFVEAIRYGMTDPTGFYAGYGFAASPVLLLTAARAATLASGERERDTWVTLLSTPLSAREIVTAKVLGNLYAMRWAVLILSAYYLMACVIKPSHLLRVPFLLGELLLLMSFCSVWGVQCSLLCRTSMASMWSAVGTVVLVGGGYMVCCFSMIGMLAISWGASAIEEMMTMAMMPCMPFLLVYPGFGLEHFAEREGLFVLAWICGTFGYAVMTLLLYLGTVADFDRRAGRTLKGPERSPT